MKLLKLKENKTIKEYEKEWETQKGYKTCDNCGTRLNDGGTCPKCDDGEEDMDESVTNIDHRVDSIIDGVEKHIGKSIEDMSVEELKKDLMELVSEVLNEQSRRKSPNGHGGDDEDPDKQERNDEDSGEQEWDGEDFAQRIMSQLDELERRGYFREGVEKYATKKVTPCCICKQPIEGYGNNAEPVCKGTCCDKCNREKVIPARINKFRGGLKESYNKVDEDTANEIALMAMRAMRLKEHEAQALEYDLIEGKADKWVKDFEALPDNSEVKKLFFTFVKKSTNESYDPKDFNIDARTPFDDEMEKIYKPLATAIKEERWEDAAKEYWELKNEFDAELQSVSKKPIIGKLFKLMAIPHTNALNNYKKSIPAEYLDRKGKKNENLTESISNPNVDLKIDGFDFEITDTFEDDGVKGYNVVYSKNDTPIVEIEIWEEDSPITIIDNIFAPRLLAGTYDSFDSFSADLISKISKYGQLSEGAPKKYHGDGIVPSQGRRTKAKGHPSDEDEMNELLDIKVDAKGFGGSGNNVHVGPGSMPLTCSYSTIDPHWDEMDYEIRKSREKDGPEFVDELHGKFSADYTGKDAVYCIVGQVKVDQSGRTYDTYYYSTIKNNWVKGSSDGTQYDSKEDAQLDLWDAQNLFVDTFGDTKDHWGNKCQLAVRIVGCKPRKRNRNNLKTNYDDDFDLTVY